MRMKFMGMYKSRNQYIIYIDWPFYFSLTICWLGDVWCPVYTGWFHYIDYANTYPEWRDEDDPKHETQVSIYKLAITFMWGD